MARRTKQGSDKKADNVEVSPKPTPDKPAEASNGSVSGKRLQTEPQPAGGDSARPSHGDKLLEWVLAGYEVGQLVADLRGGKDVGATFDAYSKAVARAADIVRDIEALGTVPDVRLEALRTMAKDPARLPDLEKELSDLKVGPQLKELKAEFLSLNVRGFEEEARKIQEKFQDPSRISEIENDIKLLKRRIKERFFEREFAVTVESTPAPGVVRPVAETVFILHKDGTLLAVKSKQPKDLVDKKALSNMIIAIRERMAKHSFESFKADAVNVIMQSGQHVCFAIAFKGDELPIIRKVMDKVIQIMERKNADVLAGWTGNRALLVDVDRYPTAIFQALDSI